MSHESSPTGSIDPSITEPGAAVPLPEPIVPDPERVAKVTRLSSEQIGGLTQYVHEATDRRLDGDDYSGALSIMKNKEGDQELGEVAVTAATVGALTRDPAKFRVSAEGLTGRMEARGMRREHLSVFFQMQRDYARYPKPMHVAETVHQGISYLNQRQNVHGEDVSQARVAFLASGFAATQDRSLREALVNQLRVG